MVGNLQENKKNPTAQVYLKDLACSIEAERMDHVDDGESVEMKILNKIFSKINECNFSNDGLNLDWKNALGIDERKVFKKFISESG